MKTYLVTRWGNDDEGPDEADTNFLVLAKDYLEASKIVDEELSKVSESLAEKFCHRITELGVADSTLDKPKIILGPLVVHALFHDDMCVPDNNKWVRDSVEEGWEKYSDYY